MSSVESESGGEKHKRGHHPNTVAHQYQPGQSGNPPGRPKGVTYPGDWIRSLLGLTRAELHAITTDGTEPVSKVMAAKALLRATANTDIADFEGILQNATCLDRLRQAGLDTSAVRKLSYRPTEHGLTISMEMYDWSDEIDRVLDRTEGRPKQSVTVEQKDERSASQLVEDVRRAVGIDVAVKES